MTNDMQIKWTGGYLSTITLASPKRHFWEPKDDITAYELAKCLPMMFYASCNFQRDYESLPEECKRHWREATDAATDGKGE